MKLKQTYRGNNFEILLVTNMFGKHFLCNKKQMCENGPQSDVHQQDHNIVFNANVGSCL